MIAAPGRGADLNGPAAQPYAPLATTAFEGMTPKVLVVVGTKDWHPPNLLRPAGLGKRRLHGVSRTKDQVGQLRRRGARAGPHPGLRRCRGHRRAPRPRHRRTSPRPGAPARPSCARRNRTGTGPPRSAHQLPLLPVPLREAVGRDVVPWRLQFQEAGDAPRCLHRIVRTHPGLGQGILRMKNSASSAPRMFTPASPPAG